MPASYSPATSVPHVSFLPSPLNSIVPNKNVSLADDAAVALQPVKPRNFFLGIGIVVLGLLVMYPVQQSLSLLYDPVFVFFLGRNKPEQIIAVCLILIVLYIIAVSLFFAFARPEGKTEVQMFALGAITVSALGLSLLLQATPLRYEAEAVYKDLISNCQFGKSTQRLYEYATVLQGLRQDEQCWPLGSVVNCEGYQERQPYTGFMRQMEVTYECSGFCFYDGTAAAASAAAVGVGVEAPTTTTTASPLMFLSQASPTLLRSASLGGALRRLVEKRGRGKEQASLLQTHLGPAVAANSGVWNLFDNAKAKQPTNVSDVNETAPARPGLIDFPVPPTLFTKSNYNESCDARAARNIKFKVMQGADLLYYEGCFLLVSTLVASFVSLSSLCTSLLADMRWRVELKK